MSEDSTLHMSFKEKMEAIAGRKLHGKDEENTDARELQEQVRQRLAGKTGPLRGKSVQPVVSNNVRLAIQERRERERARNTVNEWKDVEAYVQHFFNTEVQESRDLSHLKVVEKFDNFQTTLKEGIRDLIILELLTTPLEYARTFPVIAKNVNLYSLQGLMSVVRAAQSKLTDLAHIYGTDAFLFPSDIMQTFQKKYNVDFEKEEEKEIFEQEAITEASIVDPKMKLGDSPEVQETIQSTLKKLSESQLQAKTEPMPPQVQQQYVPPVPQTNVEQPVAQQQGSTVAMNFQQFMEEQDPSTVVQKEQSQNEKDIQGGLKYLAKLQENRKTIENPLAKSSGTSKQVYTGTSARAAATHASVKSQGLDSKAAKDQKTQMMFAGSPSFNWEAYQNLAPEAQEQVKVEVFDPIVRDVVEVGQFVKGKFYKPSDKPGSNDCIEIGSGPLGYITELLGEQIVEGKRVLKGFKFNGSNARIHLPTGSASFFVKKVSLVKLEKQQYVEVTKDTSSDYIIKVDLLKQTAVKGKYEEGYYAILETNIELPKKAHIEIEIKRTEDPMLKNLRSLKNSATKLLVAELSGSIVAGQPLPIVMKDNETQFPPVLSVRQITGLTNSAHLKNYIVTLDDKSEKKTVVILKTVQYAQVHARYMPQIGDVTPDIVKDVLKHAGGYFIHDVDYLGNHFLFSNMEFVQNMYKVYAIRKQQRPEGGHEFDFLEFRFDEGAGRWKVFSRIHQGPQRQDAFQILDREVDGFFNMYATHLPLTMNRISSAKLKTLYQREDVLRAVKTAETLDMSAVVGQHIDIEHESYATIAEGSYIFRSLLARMQKLNKDKVVEEVAGRPELNREFTLPAQYRNPDVLLGIFLDADLQHMTPETKEIVKKFKSSTNFHEYLIPPVRKIFENNRILREEYISYRERTGPGYADKLEPQVFIDMFWDKFMKDLLLPMGKALQSFPLRPKDEYVYQRFKENKANLIQKKDGEKKDFKDILEKYYVYKGKIEDAHGTIPIQVVFQCSEWDRWTQGEWKTEKMIVPYDATVLVEDEQKLPVYRPIFDLFQYARQYDQEEFMRPFWKYLGENWMKVKGQKIGESLQDIP